MKMVVNPWSFSSQTEFELKLDFNEIFKVILSKEVRGIARQSLGKGPPMLRQWTCIYSLLNSFPHL